MEQIIFKTKGREYPLPAFTIGQYFNIEATKQVLGKGFYNSIAQSPFQSGANAQEAIDMEAIITILIPDLIKDLKCDSISQLGIVDYLELKKDFDAQIVPWWNGVLEMMNPKKQD